MWLIMEGDRMEKEREEEETRNWICNAKGYHKGLETKPRKQGLMLV